MNYHHYETCLQFKIQDSTNHVVLSKLSNSFHKSARKYCKIWPRLKDIMGSSYFSNSEQNGLLFSANRKLNRTKKAIQSQHECQQTHAHQYLFTHDSLLIRNVEYPKEKQNKIFLTLSLG